jgi:hypothetical protein
LAKDFLITSSIAFLDRSGSRWIIADFSDKSVEDVFPIWLRAYRGLLKAAAISVIADKIPTSKQSTRLL